MEQAIVVILFLTLLKGFNQEQILLPPGPIIKEVGASVNFTVVSSSLSISAIKWHFNGIDFIIYNYGTQTIIPQYEDRVVLNSTSGTLELKNLIMADSGRYTLTITFTNGIGIANYTLLQVFERVFSFGISGPTDNLIEHNSYNFTCEGNGTISTAVWMKDNEILNSSRITFLDRTMVISPLMRSDSGNYQCALSNPISSSTASYSILVNYGPDVRIFGLQTFEEGSDILLFCFADSEPYVTLRWTVKGEPVRDGDLIIRLNSNPSDSGNYDCTCWNNVTGITASAVQYVTVRAESSRLAPGAEAGITLGVIFAIVIGLAVAYFFIKRSKKSAQPVEGAHFPANVSDQQTNRISGNNNVLATISTPSPQATVNKPGQHYKTSHPIYINKTPTPPPRVRGPLPRDRQTNDTNLYCTAITYNN